MSEPPPKPARRRVRRDKQSAEDEDEGRTGNALKETTSSEVERGAEGKSRDNDEDKNRDKGAKKEFADEKSSDRGDRLFERDRESKPSRGESEQKTDAEKDRDRKADTKAPPGSAGAGGSGSGNGAARASPAKAPKPARGFDSSSASANSGTGHHTDAEERDAIAARSIGRLSNSGGVLESINNMLFSRACYRMGPQSLQTKSPTPYSIRGAATGANKIWALCVHIQNILADTTGLVKPAVKMHAVYKDSGMYVKSLRLPAAGPLSTRHVGLDDITAGKPTWNQDLVLAANFIDVVTDDTLLLFEVLDIRPNLQTHGEVSSIRQPKRIAWAYLLPVSGGKVNTGLHKEWKLGAGAAPSSSSSSSSFGGKNYNGQGAAGAGRRERSREHKDDDDDDAAAVAASGEQNSESATKAAAAAYSSDPFKQVTLQLYACVEEDGVIGALQRSIAGWPHPAVEAVDRQGKCASYPDGVPSVYMQWRRHTHSPIPRGQLKLRLGPQETEFVTSSTGETTSSAVDSPHRRAGAGTGAGAGAAEESALVQADAELVREGGGKALNKAKSFAIKRLRAAREPCSVPDRLLHRLEVGPEGAMTVQFSHTGHLLAVAGKVMKVTVPYSGAVGASPLLGETYSLQLFDTDSGESVWRNDNAHHGVIYGISWSLDNSYLVTSSGDGTVKVWDVDCFRSEREGAGSGSGGDVNTSQSNDKEKEKDKDEAASVVCMYTHVSSPPAYMYCAIFQEYAPALRGASNTTVVNNVLIQDEFFSKRERGALPRVIAGGSDGRIRVWDAHAFKGYISVTGGGGGEGGGDGADGSAPTAHDSDRVQALTIDSRSRYLISGDSVGNMYVWRTDAHGWYQLLRRFKLDDNATAAGLTAEFKTAQLMQSGGVQSLSMHPDKSKSQMLVLNQCPPHLKLYSTSTYKPIAACSGVGAGQVVGKTNVSSRAAVNSSNVTGAVFGRAELSPDGRFAIAGISSLNAGNDGHYKLKVWEARHGNVYPATLSEINLPYPVRSISWHPEQHVVAVAMVGQGAAVAIYCGERESAELAVGRMAADALDSHLSAGVAGAENVKE